MNSIAIVSEREEPLLTALVREGVDGEMARYLIGRFPELRIRAQLRALPYRAQPAGRAFALIDAIRTNRAMPKALRDGDDEPAATGYVGPYRNAKPWTETQIEISSLLRRHGVESVQWVTSERDRRVTLAFEKQTTRTRRCPAACQRGCDICSNRVLEKNGDAGGHRRRRRSPGESFRFVRRPISGGRLGYIDAAGGLLRVRLDCALSPNLPERNSAFRLLYHYLKAKFEALAFQLSDGTFLLDIEREFSGFQTPSPEQLRNVTVALPVG
jgi:hypothetical protein